jgi:hypothetical protein
MVDLKPEKKDDDWTDSSNLLSHDYNNFQTQPTLQLLPFSTIVA